MKKKVIVNYINVFLFLLPALALFIGILIAPIIKSLYYSFFNWNGMGAMEFIQKPYKSEQIQKVVETIRKKVALDG